MKNQKIKLLSIASLLLFGVSFVACSDDDDNGIIDVESKVECFSYKADYKFTEDFLSIADITMYYINGEGGLSSEVLKTTTWSKTVTSKTLPFIIDTYYVIQRKSGELTKEVYDLAVNRTLEYHADDATGKMLSYNKLERKMESFKVGANKIPLYFEKFEGQNNDEFNYSVSLKDTGDGVDVVPIVK